MAHGFVYLTAVLDWATRKVLAWRLSNNMAADACVDALEQAISQYGAPEIMNTDQGSQFTGATTHSSSGCGNRSSMKRSICMPTSR